MKIVKVGVTISRAIKVADYKYYKPAIYMEAVVDENEQYNQIMGELKSIAKTEMQTLIDEEKALYRERLEEAKLEQVLRDYEPDEVEYKLAEKELKRMRAGRLE